MDLEILGGRGQSRHGHCGHKTYKMAVSQEGIHGINWFFAWFRKFRKAKSYLNNFWVGVFKNGRNHFGQGTLNPFMHNVVKWPNML